MKLLLTILFVLLVSKFTKVKASYHLPPVPLPVYFNCFAKHYREVGRKLSEPLTMGIIEVFQDICRYPDALIECVARDVPKSDMLGDILLNTVLDIGDPNRVKKVLGITCKQMSSITNQDLLTAARCLHQNSTVNTFEHTCGSSIETVKRLANIKSMPSDTQSLCRPLKNELMCVTKAADDACDQELSQIAKNFALELLKTNCGGERPLTGGKGTNSIDFTMLHYVLQLASSAFRFFL